MSGFIFRKSFALLPGLRLNLSKSGPSLSIGPEGAHVTTGKRGTRLFVDLPGSGMYFTRTLASKKKTSEDKQTAEAEADSGPKPPELSFLQKLTAPQDQVALVEALRAYFAGDTEKALEQAKQATHLADGCFLAGVVALHLGLYEDAATYLNSALEKADELGKNFAQVEVGLDLDLPITEEVVARIRPDENGVLLALAETYQAINRPDRAYNTLQALYKKYPDDIMVRVSLAELLSLNYPEDKQVQEQIVQLAEGVHNESHIHAALMLYQAWALRQLGLLDGARDTLARALRRKKGYPPDLLAALRYERGLVYEAQGDPKMARKEYEKIFAQAPGFADVAAKLGL